MRWVRSCLAAGAILAVGTVAGATFLEHPDRAAISSQAAIRSPTPSIAASGAATLPPPDGVLPALDPNAAIPSPAGLSKALSARLTSPALGSQVSYAIADAATGSTLLASDADAPRHPASTAKVITAAAVLSLLGPDARLATRVVDGATADEVVLVGGGDVLLAADRGNPSAVNGHAGLADLAASTAASLTAEHRTTVAVRLDDSAFAGPPISASWRPQDVVAGYVAPVEALEVDAGRAYQSRYARRLPDPAMSAATVFADRLSRNGIHVAGPIARSHAEPDVRELARVESATVADLVEYALTESDNTVAEALARLVARHSGRPATFADAGVAVLDRVSVLGVPVGRARLSGGSGLGRSDVLTAQSLAAVLALAAGPDHTELRPLLSGLPIAAVSGTLADRYSSPALAPGAGVVRAKTGSLATVVGLAGTVVDASGRQLVFAILADQVPALDPARRAMDAVAVTLASCGCS